MNKVGHDLIEKPLNHSRSESFPLVVPLGHGMGRMFRKFEFNEKLHLREIGLGVGVRNIIWPRKLRYQARDCPAKRLHWHVYQRVPIYPRMPSLPLSNKCW
jgi:hypothetical protein